MRQSGASEAFTSFRESSGPASVEGFTNSNDSAIAEFKNAVNNFRELYSTANIPDIKEANNKKHIHKITEDLFK